MPTLTIGDKSVSVGDEFLKLSPEQQNAAVADIAQSLGSAATAPAEKPLGFDPNDVRFQNRSPAAALGGIPILGAGVQKAGAAISAAAQPVTGVGDNSSNFADRYVKNLEQEEAAKADYEKQHPIKSAVEGMVGGTLALGGAAGLSGTVAKALGMVGPAKTAVPLAVASGGALGAGDAALRGEDPLKAGLVGGATGGLGVLGGKLLGAGYNALRPKSVVPHTIDVNGEAIPVPKPVMTGSEADWMAANTAKRQGNDAIREIANTSFDTMDEGLRGAGQTLKAGFGDPGGPPHTARSAAEKIRQSFQDNVAADKAGVNAKYEAYGAVPGEYNTDPLRNTAKVVRADLDQTGTNKVFLDDLTPQSKAALNFIDTELGQSRFTDAASTPLKMGPDGRPVARPVTAQVVDQIRKNLVNYRSEAVASGKQPDVRAMTRIINAFDEHIANVTKTPGGFSGDAAALLKAKAEAQQAHADYRNKYFAQGPKDTAGKAIEGMVGGRGATPAELEKIIPQLFGTPESPGGAEQAKLLKRIIKTFGENSPEADALRHGQFSHIADMPAGMAPVGHKVMADRISKLMEEGGKGKGLSSAEALYSPEQIQKTLNLAAAHRRAVPPAGTINTSESGNVTMRGIKKIASVTARAALPIIGAHFGGPMGLAAGMAGERLASAAINRQAQRAAREIFQGKRAKLPEPKLPQSFGALGGYLAAGQSRQR